MMRRRIGIGTVLFLSMLSVILILTVTIGFYGIVLERRSVEREDRLLVGEFTRMQREILRAEVDRSVQSLRDPRRRPPSGEAGPPMHPPPEPPAPEPRRKPGPPVPDTRTREEFLDRVGSMRVGDDGFMFVLDYDGILLAHSEFPDQAGRNAYELSREDGARVFYQMMQTVRKGGGYLEYHMLSPETGDARRRIAYVAAVPELRWIVGAAVDADAFDRRLANRRLAYIDAAGDHWRMLIVAFLSALGMSLLASIFLSRRVKNEFDRFARVFDRAVSAHETMDPGDLNLAEFTLLSEDANRMIETIRSAEEARAASEKTYRAVVEDLPLLLCRFRADGTLTFVNDAYCRYFGRDRECLVGQSFFSLIPDEAHEMVSRHYSSLTPGNPVRTYDHPVFAPDGETRWQRWIDRAVFEDGRLLEYQSIGEDITERRGAEEALRASEEKFSRAFRLNPSLMLLMDAHTREILEVNESFTRMVGYRSEEVVGSSSESYTALMDPEERGRMVEEMEGKGRISGFRIHFCHRDGTEHVGLLSAETLDMGRRRVALVTVNDITALEQAREEYRESERRLATLMDNLPGLAFRCRNDPFWTFEYASGGAVALTGYTPGEIVGNRVVAYIDLILPEDRDMIRDEIQTSVAEHRQYVIEYRIRDRAGDIRWVWEKGTGIFGENGELQALEGFVIDITDRRRGEEALRVSEEKFSRIFHSSPGVIALLDWETRRALEVNENFTRVLGYTSGEVLGKTPGELDVWVDDEERRITGETVSREGRLSNSEIRFRCRDGSIRHGLVSMEPLELPERNALLVVLNDITSLTEAQEALRESERNYRTLIESMDNGFANHRIITDENGNPADFIYIEVNDAFERHTGQRREDVVGRTETELTPGIRQERFDWIGAYGRVALTGEPARFEQYSEALGKWFSVSAYSSRPGYFVTNFYDITPRINAEEALRESEERLNFAMNATSDGVWDWNIDKEEHYFSPGYYRMLGYAPGEFPQSPGEWESRIHPEDRERTLRANLDCIGNRTESFEIEFRMRARDGGWKWILGRGMAVARNEQGKALRMIGTHQDITARKLAEAEREHTLSLLRATLEATEEGIIVEGPDRRMTVCNRRFVDLWGIPGEIVGGGDNEAMLRFAADRFEDPEGFLSLVEEYYADPEREGSDVLYFSNGRVYERFTRPQRLNGAVVGRVWSFRDITRRVAAERSLRESEEDLNRAQGVAHTGSWRLDIRKNELRWSSENYRIFGFPEGSPLTYETFLGAVHPEDREYVDRKWKAALAGEPYDIEHRLVVESPGETEKWVREQAELEFDGKGELTGGFGTTQDITERKRAEEALRFAWFSLEQSRDTALWVEADGRLTRPNEAACRLMGYSREEIEERYVYDVDSNISAGDWPEFWRGMVSGEVSLHETMIIRKSGERIPVEISVSHFSFGGRDYIFASGRDTTERNRAEGALRESEKLLSTVLDTLPVGVWILNESGRIIRGNPAGLRIWSGALENVPPERWVFSGWWPDTGEQLTPEEWASRRAINRGEVILGDEVEIECFDGSRKIMLNSAIPLRNERGEIAGGIIVNEDITARKRAEDDLREEKERLAVTLRSIGDGVITTDREGRVALMNRVAEDLTGWLQEDAEGHALEEVFHIVDERTRETRENPFLRVIESGGIVEMANHTMLISRDGREIVLADSGAPILDRYSRIIGVVLVFRDVTDRNRLEDEFQKMEKLESVGVLAGGIAHDFNNILTGIIGALSLIRLTLPPGHDAMEILGEAEHQSLRARDLTGQLLTFSKGGAPIRITASIVETVRETVSFVIRGSRVRALFSLPETLWAAQVDLNQLSQVVNNLALNAVQAMPGGGRIEVGAENITIGNKRTLPLSPGRYILLTIRDTGAGISREYLSRIFDPYFTTKQMGSGLGLATTYSIIKRHDGHIEVESELGRGTVFRIYLPAADVPVPVPEPAPVLSTAAVRGRVLIMDDDKHVRNMAGMLLEALGYTVETAGDGAETIDRYRAAREAGEPFDAIIMDLTIPDGMGGLETMEELIAFDPSVRAIVSSGYSTDPVMAEYRRHGFSGVLVKPYRLEEIARVLHDVIQSA